MNKIAERKIEISVQFHLKLIIFIDTKPNYKY